MGKIIDHQRCYKILNLAEKRKKESQTGGHVSLQHYIFLLQNGVNTHFQPE